MGTQYLIDSNVVIDYLSNKLPPPGMSLLNDVVDDIPNVSIISKIEVLGFNAPPQDYQLLQNFFQDAIIFELLSEVVDRAIELRKAYKIKLGDSIIAATALTYDLNLLARNTNDFKQLANLRLINPHEL